MARMTKKPAPKYHWPKAKAGPKARAAVVAKPVPKAKPPPPPPVRRRAMPNQPKHEAETSAPPAAPEAKAHEPDPRTQLRADDPKRAEYHGPDPLPSDPTIADEQRKRSEEIEKEGVEKYKARLDQRAEADKPKQVAGVGSTEVEDEPHAAKRGR